MTIRMLQAWNGLHQQKIVTTLSGGDEAALVAAGIATYDLDGPAENLRMAQLAADPITGNVTGLVGPGNNKIPFGASISRANGLMDIMPVDDLTRWTTDKTAALVLSLDTSVTFQGRPTLKITIPAGTSGVCKIGTSAADALVPYLYDRNNFCVAVMQSGFTGYDMSSTFPPAPTAYLGDSTYANFWTVEAYTGANYPEQKDRQGEWLVHKVKASQMSATGSPATVLGDGTYITSTAVRSKLQWTQVSQATDCYMWIGFVGAMPARTKPTIVWTLDDGFATWYSFIAPLFKHYDMPVSLAIDSALVGTANYLTAAQIQALFNDPSRLFDIVNHGVNNQSYNSLGAAAYYATVEATRVYLQNLGITGDGPYHHAYVQSVWGNDLVDLMVAGGYLSARASSASVPMHGYDQVIESDKLRWHLNIELPLVGTKTLAQANTAIDAIVSNGGVGMINGHNFVKSGPSTYQWTFADMQQLVGRVAALRAAGTVEVKSWSKWYADLTGRFTNRR